MRWLLCFYHLGAGVKLRISLGRGPGGILQRLKMGTLGPVHTPDWEILSLVLGREHSTIYQGCVLIARQYPFLLCSKQRKGKAELLLLPGKAQDVCGRQPPDTAVRLMVHVDFLPEMITLPVWAQECAFASPILCSPCGHRHRMLCAISQKKTRPFPSSCVFSLYTEHSERSCDFFFLIILLWLSSFNNFIRIFYWRWTRLVTYAALIALNQVLLNLHLKRCTESSCSSTEASHCMSYAITTQEDLRGNPKQ